MFLTGKPDLATKNQSAPVQISLAANIRLLREKKDWSQEDLAHKSGIHVTYLSGLECGRRNPTVKVLEQLAKALGVHISVLFKTQES
jgi:transcriptional regulator with XRE-family HTH domain